MYSVELWIGLALAAIILLFTTANFSLRHLSRVHLSEQLEKRGRARLLNRLVEARSELLFGLSFVRLSAIIGLVLLVAHIFGIKPTSHPVDQIEPLTQYSAIFISSLVLVMVVGVALPSAWVRYGGDSFLAAVLPVLFALRYVLYPLIMFHNFFDGLVRRLAGIPQTDQQQDEADQIEKEILDVVSEGELAGAVHEEDAEMIESVMGFRDTDVGEIMTPRIEIIALPATATLTEAKQLIAREGHSRIPLYGENIDDIKGVLYAKDLLNIDDEDEFEASKVMRQVPFVPEAKRIPDLFRELREKKVHLAIVLDEYGGTAGLVTIEDILEEIVGEITDEYETPEPELIRRIDANRIEVDARVRIDEINRELNTELPEDQDYDTVGGFVFSAMGKIPTKGEELLYNNIKFHVLDAEEHKINRLRLELINTHPSGES